MEKAEKSHLELGKAHFAKGLESFEEGMKFDQKNEYMDEDQYHEALGAIDEFTDAIREFTDAIDEITCKSISMSYDYEIDYLDTPDLIFFEQVDNDQELIYCNLRDAYLWRGRTLHALGKYNEAINNYNSAIEICEAHEQQKSAKCSFISKVHYHIGLSHAECKEDQIAIEFYTMYIDCCESIYFDANSVDDLKFNDPISLAKAYFSRGESYCIREEYIVAIKDYNKAIAIFQTTKYELDSDFQKNILSMYRARGDVYYAIKNYNSAINDYTKSICTITKIASSMHYEDFNYTIVHFHNNRGACHFYLNEYSLAIDDFTNVIAYAKDNAVHFPLNETYLWRAASHCALGDTKAAISDYRSEMFRRRGKFPDETPLDGYLRIGELLIKENKYEDAMASFKEYTGKLIEVIGSCSRPKGASKLKLRKEVLYSFVDKDKFLTDTLKGIDKNVDLYKDIYIQSLELVEILHVKDLSSNSLQKQPEPEVAHYTTKIASEKMLFKKDHKEASPIRLASVATSNDPQEGLSLLACLGLSNDNIESDYESFITCFTFNHDCLNQFRLYGKENNKEATGVSLVIDRNYFKSYLDELPASAKIKSKEKKIPEVIESKGDLSNLEQEIIDLKQEVVNLKQTLTPKQDPPSVPDKLSLYRCVYIDPETGQVVSVGHRESYTFYRESPTWERDEVKKYEDEIAEIVEKFSVGFGNLKKEVDKLKKAIAKENKETQIMHEGILSKSLLHLRYLVSARKFKFNPFVKPNTHIMKP